MPNVKHRRTIPYPALAAALAVSGEHRYHVASRADMSPSTLAAIVYGRCTPTPDQRAAIARALRKPETDLFAAA